MEYAEVKSLPTPIQDALSAVGYGRKDIEVRAASTVVLSRASSDGFRAFVTLVNLTSGQHNTTWGSWGGANMFDRTNAVDNDDKEYTLPGNGVAITGSRGGGKPVYATLNVPASMVTGMLPSSGAALSKVEADALSCFKSLKSGPYRKDALERANVTSDVLDGLVTRGLLSRNRSGATSITTAGKNALGSHRV